MAKFTKQAIYDSFMKFLNERPLGQITVKDIVVDCGINRKTFYYYFQDIYALTDELFRSHIETVRTKYPAESHSWEEVLQLITDYMYENRKVALHIYRTLGYEKIDGIFFEVGMEYIPNLIGTYVAVGVACYMGFQSFINIAVATGTMPNTGQPLPFISYGLSSLMSASIAIGMVLNIYLQRKRH